MKAALHGCARHALGNGVYANDVLISSFTSSPRSVPRQLKARSTKSVDLYWDKGYNDVRSDYDLVINRGAGEVSVAFTIIRGPENVIAGITIQGNRRVSNRLIQRQIQLLEAQPPDSERAGPPTTKPLRDRRVRRRYHPRSGRQPRVPQRLELPRATTAMPRAPQAVGERAQGLNGTAPSPADEPPAAPPPAHARPEARQCHRADREVQPIQIRMAPRATRNEASAASSTSPASIHLAGPREIGLRSRYDKQLHEGRFYINQPALTYLPKTTGNVHFREELNPHGVSPILSIPRGKAPRFNRSSSCVAPMCGATDTDGSARTD